MNDVNIAFWPPETCVVYLATGYLNACTGLAIISPQAGILAHIAPLAPGSTTESLAQNPDAAKENVLSLLRAVAQLHVTHRAKFASPQTFVVAGIFDNTPAMGDALRLLRDFLANLGLPVVWKSYTAMLEGPRPIRHSSIIIHAASPGVMPVVYVNGLRIN